MDPRYPMFFDTEEREYLRPLSDPVFSDDITQPQYNDPPIQDLETELPSQDMGSSSLPPRSTKRSRTSGVWLNFTIESVGSEEKAVCNHCKKQFSCKGKGGTGHLNRHLQKCLPKHGQIDPRQTQISTSSVAISNFIFNQEETRLEIVKWVIQEELPFRLIDSKRFHRLITKYLAPQFKPFSRHTLRKDAIKLYGKMKTALIETLSNSTFKIALTSDIWTSRQQISYLAITAHYIDENWNMEKRIITFEPLDASHTGINISNAISRNLRNYKIHNKIMALALDNASANNVAVGILRQQLNLNIDGSLFHVKCACHILNLVVQDGLKIVQHHLINIRDAVRFIKQSSTTAREFKYYCETLGKQYKKITLDVEHRWNSTYIMLEAALGLKQEITIFYKSKMPESDLEDLDWQIAEILRDFLKVFYDATRYLSVVYYPTSSSIITCLYQISICFKQYRNVPIAKEIIPAMETKILKYWQEMPNLYCLATTMDPRIKLGVEDLIDGINENMNSTFQIDIRKIRNLLERLFCEYDTSSSIQGHTRTQQTLPDNSPWNFLSGRRKGKQPASSSGGSSELMIYLESPPMSFNTIEEHNAFNILTWWKQNQVNYPVLSAMARDLLTVPVSTVASESAFSAGGRTVDDYRSRLTPEMVQACVSLTDWLRAELREQEYEDDQLAGDFDDLNIDFSQPE